MKTLLLIFQLIAVAAYAQKGDTVAIGPGDLQLKNLNYGSHMYLVYSKKSKTSPAERSTLVKINVERKNSVIVVAQQWDMDTIVHKAETQFDSRNFTTLTHDTYWKRLGYTAKFDFVNKRVYFEGRLADSLKAKATKEMNDSFSKYNLNWHSDLMIFPLLPFKENRVFKINFYDPGFGKPTEVFYRVEGSEQLSSAKGKMDCWVLVIRHTKPQAAIQKFWISKASNEVLKEEDEFGGRYRYKLKLAVAEN
ncbi:MAG TPA: hypothetical protein VL728_02380 [Cyclobacteriaceae bacterium]|nr:hypothetical protein [Cyclobacteriaceae bacterium]